jgi:hypothetical protein
MPHARVFFVLGLLLLERVQLGGGGSASLARLLEELEQRGRVVELLLGGSATEALDRRVRHPERLCKEPRRVRFLQLQQDAGGGLGTVLRTLKRPVTYRKLEQCRGHLLRLRLSLTRIG